MSEEIEIKVQNVVASITLNTKLDLNLIAEKLQKVIYEPEQFPGLVYRLKKPSAAFLIFSSGKLVCTGTKSEESVRKALDRVLKEFEKIGINVKNKPTIKVENIVASADIKKKINLEKAIQTLGNAIYEPEQFPGLIFKLDYPSSVLLLFSSGKLVCTGTNSLSEIYRSVYKVKEILREKSVLMD